MNVSGDSCTTCGRDLIDYRDPPRPDDPRINCGGDCLACQHGFEEDCPEDVRCTAPRFSDEAKYSTAFTERLRADTGQDESVPVLEQLVAAASDSARKHIERAEELQADNDRLRAALFECAKESGADVSGGAPTSPPLHVWAVEEVRQMRRDFEEDQ